MATSPDAPDDEPAAVLVPLPLDGPADPTEELGLLAELGKDALTGEELGRLDATPEPEAELPRPTELDWSVFPLVTAVDVELLTLPALAQEPPSEELAP